MNAEQSDSCGYLAHFLCFRKILYRQHVIRFNGRGEVLSCTPFDGESAFTAFYDGILFAVSSDFPPALFLEEFIQRQREHHYTSLVEAILSNPVYLTFADPSDRLYRLYQLSPVDWSGQQLLPDTTLTQIG